mgnify:FL=1
MKNLKKYLFVLLGVFLSGVMVPSTLFAEAVSVPSQTFDLGAVQGVWDQTAQTLTVQGNGKIDRDKWFQMRNTLKLTVDSISKIEFTSGVQFSDDASRFFEGFQTEKIVFPNGMNTSNVTNMEYMFVGASKLKEGNFSDWDTSNVKKMGHMFDRTSALESPVNFRDASNVEDMAFMFWNSKVPSVSIGNVGKVKDMNRMFEGALVEKVEIGNTSSVENMSNMFAHAKKLKDGNMSEWDTSKAKNLSAMFYGASQFNQDLSNWNLSSASNLDGFIWSDNSFEQDNYEKFLKKLEASNLDPTTMESRTIHVSTTYCAAASIRNKLTARGFVLNDKGMDCKIQVTFDAPTKQASGDIVDTKIRVSAKLPLDPTKVTILPQTTIGNQDLSCQKDGDDNHLVCSIKLTSTQRGNRLAVQAALDVAISSWTRIPSPTP